MRNPKPGILKFKWQDFEFKGIGGIIQMTKEKFEENYGKFEAMLFPQNEIKPYAVWSEKYVVLFLDEDPYGISSVPRNPEKYIFG